MNNLRNLTCTDTNCSCPGKKILAIIKPTKGATIQLDIKVKMIGFGFFPNFFNSDFWRFNIPEYIIKNKHIPIGIEIPRIYQESIDSLTVGIILDRIIPRTMHKNIQIGRNFSK